MAITISHGKAKRVDVIPMHPQLAEELARRRNGVLATPRARVFPTTVTDRTRLKDFKRAGISPIDDEGRVIDLHAMRTTLGTNLARAGVAPQLAQRIMRHGDYRTTLKHYTVLGLSDTANAVNQLPTIDQASSVATRATGTCDSQINDLQQNDPHLKSHQRQRESAHLDVRIGAKTPP